MLKVRVLLVLLLVSPFAFASIWDNDYQGVEWHTNYQQALALAVEKDLPVLVYFSGSDWCNYCIRLDKKILTKEKFQQYAQTQLILVNLDCPAEKELPAELKTQNTSLAKRFGIKSFPFLVLVDAGTDTRIGSPMGCLPIICYEKSFIRKIEKTVGEYKKAVKKLASTE